MLSCFGKYWRLLGLPLTAKKPTLPEHQEDRTSFTGCGPSVTQLPTGQAPSAGKHTIRCTPTSESSKPAPPSFERMLLRTGRYQVGSDGCSPHRMLLGTGRYQVGSDGCSPHRMLLGTGRYQVGSDGCSPHRMLLGTGRYQVGSDGCSPHRMGWQRWMLAPSDSLANERHMQIPVCPPRQSQRPGRHPTCRL